MIDIIIPSNKPYPFLRSLVALIKEHDTDTFNYIPTGFEASASVNRNYGLHEANKSSNEYIIMIDDDISGFFTGWQTTLIAPLKADPSVRMSTARLMNPDAGLAPMLGVHADLAPDILYLPRRMPIEGLKFSAILSAAVAFRKKDIAGLHFNYNFLGSGYEDTHFCWQLCKRFSDCQMVCANRCILTHANTTQNQNKNLKYNQKVFKELCQP